MPRLTDSRIAGLKPKAARYEVWDDAAGGFGLRVGQGGTKTFILVYHFAGRPRRLTLGSYPKMGLADARVAAGRAWKMLEQGDDPGRAAVAERVAERSAETVDQLCDDYLARHARPRKRSSSAAEDERLLKRDVRPHWRDRKAADIRRRDVVAMLDRIIDRGALVTANRTLAVVRRMFNFAIERGVTEASPCIGVKAPHKETPRERVLSAPEIKALWQALDASSMEANIKTVLRFLLATGSRRAEALGLHEREIDVKAKTWTLPAARSKNGRERLIPLSQLALDLLAEAKPYEPKKHEPPDKGKGWIFPSGRTGEPYRGRSIDHAVRDLFTLRDVRGRRRRKDGTAPKPPALVEMQRFTPHDLRHTAATEMRALGISSADVGLVLGHAAYTVTGRVYDHFDGLPEKRRALDLWGKRLAEIVAGKIEADNVVDLPSRTAEV